MQTWGRLVTLTFSLGCGMLAGWGQAVTLSGQVTEKYQNTPIEGAQIVLDDKVLGISGQDGTYSVTLPKQGKLVVVYKQINYVAHQYELNVVGVTKHHAELYKRSDSAEYWKTVAQSIKVDAGRQNNSVDFYQKAWADIDTSRVSPEAKGVAARQIFVVLPVPEKAPATLIEYKNTDASKMQESAKFFDQALTSEHKLQSVELAPPIAADIAAEQVKQAKVTHKTVQPKFYTEFHEKFGTEASQRLKTQIQTVEK